MPTQIHFAVRFAIHFANHFGIRFCAFKFVLFAGLTYVSAQDELTNPIISDNVVFTEKDGMLAVEAEHFFKQTLTEKRAFFLTTKDTTPATEKDGDASHVAGASGGAYLEILPDTRRNHGHKLIHGENFSNQPGKLAVLHYKVNITNPGRYYIWVRAHSTGSEDNGLHVGIDGEWPDNGQRMQWCAGKHTWRWESKQRTAKEHCGVPHEIYLDIKKAGEHVIHFSMREDGFEFDKWLMTKNRNFKRPSGIGPGSAVLKGDLPKPFPFVEASTTNTDTPKDSSDKRDYSTSPTTPVLKKPLYEPRGKDGAGEVKITGEKKLWHKITFSLDGPWAHEQDNEPNPFIDYELTATFKSPGGKNSTVPGFFAADGNASESSAESGNIWRAHFAPNETGDWEYELTLRKGKSVALSEKLDGDIIHQIKGRFAVSDSDKTGRDLRAHGRLQYVGKRYLQHAGSKKYFLKAGADAPETLLAYKDFDNTIAMKKNVPLKSFQPHLRDWNKGDPTWKGGKGKGLIGAINYLSGKGCNAFSFLTYNAGGDGNNIWPFIDRDDKLHYDCSKLDQWAIVLDHGTARGMYLHFKMQETEMDDHRVGHGKNQPKSKPYVPTCLDGGNLGVQRKLYCRELIARFGHNLALNWNLGEENTQSTKQQQAMIDYIAATDTYDHNIVIHTFPDQQDRVYDPLLGNKSKLTGVSLQNGGIKNTHWQAVKWVRKSTESGKPWVVAFDESGTAAHGQCPDLGYKGFDGKDADGKMIYTQHEVRRQTLWGTLMAGGAGVEYYFGYKFAENDLVCEDWRSRDRSWDYCRTAIEFFHQNRIPFAEMMPRDELLDDETRGNKKPLNAAYCLAKPDEIYLVFLAKGGKAKLDLRGATGKFSLERFDPRKGGEPVRLNQSLTGGKVVEIDSEKENDDWLLIIRKN